MLAMLSLAAACHAADVDIRHYDADFVSLMPRVLALCASPPRALCAHAPAHAMIRVDASATLWYYQAGITDDYAEMLPAVYRRYAATYALRYATPSILRRRRQPHTIIDGAATIDACFDAACLLLMPLLRLMSLRYA